MTDLSDEIMGNRDRFLYVSNVQDDTWSRTLKRTLAPLGGLQTCAETELASFISGTYRLILVDAASVADLVKLIAWIQARQPRAGILVATATPTWKQARQVLSAGATDYVRKVADEKETLQMVEEALRMAERGSKDIDEDERR